MDERHGKPTRTRVGLLYPAAGRPKHRAYLLFHCWQVNIMHANPFSEGRATSTRCGTEPFVAACVQAAPVNFDTEKTLEKVRSRAADAARMGAKIVLFPEAFIGGYPRGASFGAVVGSRTPEGRDQFRMYHAAAIDIPGPAIDILSGIARENSVYLVVGVIERERGTLYCTIVFFDPAGALLGKHRKLMPTAMERLVWGYGDGSTMPVFDSEVGRLGAVICWENYMPLMRTAMYGEGIQLYCAPTADQRPIWVTSMQHIASEGRCFVLSTNQFAKRGDYPAGYVSNMPDDPQAIVCRGGACIVSPFGDLLAGPLWDREGILTAEVDLREIPRAQYDFDPVGHYSRPDVFRLSVNRTAKLPVRYEVDVEPS
jgi:nitrilase